MFEVAHNIKPSPQYATILLFTSVGTGAYSFYKMRLFITRGQI